MIAQPQIKAGGRLPLPDNFFTAVRPPELLTVSQWADRYRQLNRKYAAEAGRWETAKTPYLREPMDALTESGVQTLIFMKCSRIGGTEWLNNLIAFTIDARPLPIMYAQPEKPAIIDEFSGRLRSMIEDSEKLRRHIGPGEWATTTRIVLDTCDIHGAWAENPRTMIRKTIGLAVFDEIDNCEKAAGNLGNTLDVLGERLVTYGHRAKLVADGTPTTDAASGWRMLQASDFRKPHVPCPHCGTFQVLYFDGIQLMEGREEERDPDTIETQQLAGYRCKQCEVLIDHRQWHRWMIDRVIWIPKTQEPAEPLPVKRRSKEAKRIVETESLAVQPPGKTQWMPKLEGEAPRTSVRGYWINCLYSPWPTRTWSHILAQFFRVKDDPERFRVFNNSWLAEPWRDAIVVTDVDHLMSKVLDGPPRGVVPETCKILLMGADVQIDHMYYTLYAFGPLDTAYLIDHGTVETFDALYDIAFFHGYPVRGEDTLMRSHLLGIDRQYRKDEVLQFAMRPGVVPVAGRVNVDFRTKPFKNEFTPSGRTAKSSVKVFHVNTDLFKSKLHRLAALAVDQPGSMMFHDETDAEFFRQFTAEEQVWTKVSGRRGSRRELVWQLKRAGAPNHYLDCSTYALALADICRVSLMRFESPRVGEMDELATIRNPVPKRGKGRSAPTKPTQPPAAAGGWLT